MDEISRVAIAVVCTSGAESLARCLTALRHQIDAPSFDITVVSDPALGALDDVRQRFPEVRVVVNAGQRTPLELVSRALRECDAGLVLLTKDYCVPGPGWVRAMVDAQRDARGAVGGRVEVAPDASATEWAYYFIDFHPYSEGAAGGPAPSLTVCNVAYRRAALDTVRATWEKTFVEVRVNAALSERFGSLWLEPASTVIFERRLTLAAAVRERYAFGRLFGCSRLDGCSSGRRLLYAALAPALPAVLLGRMARTAVRSRRHTAALVRGWLPLTLMVLGRSWGEWLGYLTGRPPRSLVTAA
ncbi:MAG TPA: glycosyltransferase [Vicinamibacterales bacterium]